MRVKREVVRRPIQFWEGKRSAFLLMYIRDITWPLNIQVKLHIYFISFNNCILVFACVMLIQTHSNFSYQVVTFNKSKKINAIFICRNSSVGNANGDRKSFPHFWNAESVWNRRQIGPSFLVCGICVESSPNAEIECKRSHAKYKGAIIESKNLILIPLISACVSNMLLFFSKKLPRIDKMHRNAKQQMMIYYSVSKHL